MKYYTFLARPNDNVTIRVPVDRSGGGIVTVFRVINNVESLLSDVIQSVDSDGVVITLGPTITAPENFPILLRVKVNDVTQAEVTGYAMGTSTAPEGGGGGTYDPNHTHVKAQITDFAHTHPIGDLPVAPSGTVSTTQLVRADDTRLSNARTPTAHTHGVTDINATGTRDGTTALHGDGTWKVPAGTGTSVHSHDDRYYTETEVNTLLSGKANTSHVHAVTDLSTTGTRDSSTVLYGDGAWRLPPSGGGGTTGAGTVEVTVAAAGAPADVKAACNYVCDGVGDQVEINAAIDKAFASGGAAKINGVLLVGGRFYINNSIVMKAHTQVRGLGLGTSITSVGMGAVGMFTLADKNHHMTTIRDLTLWGNSSSGGSSHAIYYVQSDANGDGSTGTYFPGNSPDASHRFFNLYIKEFSGGTRHGLWMGDSVRDPNAHHVRVFGCSGDGFKCGGSDGKYVACIAASCGRGWSVEGGSNQFTGRKTAYSVGVGWNVTSSRAHLTSCHSQDSGTHGYVISGVDPTLVSCIADSNSRLSTTAFGMVLSSDRAVVEGLHAYDRNQSPPNHQDRSIQFNGANDVYVTGSTRVWTPGVETHVTGTPGGNSFVRLIRIAHTDGTFRVGT